MLVALAVFEANKPGPSSDPASMWQRHVYVDKMTAAEDALNANKYTESAAAYKSAYEQAANFGDGNDKKIRSLSGWLTALQRGGGNKQDVDEVREKFMRASLQHMVYLCDHGPKDFPEIIDMDAGLLKSIEPGKLNSKTAGDFSREMVDNAKKAFHDGSCVKAISWLNEALRLEEQAHMSGDVTACAAEFEESAAGKAHAEEIHKLLERARSVEHDGERKERASR